MDGGFVGGGDFEGGGGGVGEDVLRGRGEEIACCDGQEGEEGEMHGDEEDLIMYK